jgi:hypothetical protein
MKINANEIRISDSPFLNKDLWVCDLRFNNSIEKPIRKVVPTKINLVSNDKVSKRIYYSDNSLVPYNKKEELVFSKAFGIYDNTGFRSLFTGVPLEIFDSEEECKNQYKKLIKLAIQFINKKKEEFVNSADIQIKNLESEL